VPLPEKPSALAGGGITRQLSLSPRRSESVPRTPPCCSVAFPKRSQSAKAFRNRSETAALKAFQSRNALQRGSKNLIFAHSRRPLVCMDRFRPSAPLTVCHRGDSHQVGQVVRLDPPCHAYRQANRQ
jgi:hypothetical protein